MPIYGEPIVAYPAAPVRDGSATGWAEGHVDAADENAIPANRLIPLRPSRSGESKARAVRCYPAGDGSANDQYTVHVWAVVRHAGSDDRTQVRLGTFAVTLGATAPDAGVSLLAAADLVADTVGAFSATDAGTAWLASVGAADPGVYSPADDTYAFFHLPDCGQPEAVAFEFTSDNAAKRGQLLVEVFA